ncbi:hypothetical protein [uncultured Roseivirga sp.]|uniref:hypothetical protein n=1 Tax=uncultured Roseivirga sp. TaxID=543088 RepID=UPI000D7A7D81|nr:hypothetical protein [uncultured Roseivirga sp.]PWL29972.1 MAG: hypothetical protein DCO95_09055 [Roseivirga sp. XM-24bin3]
MKKPLYLIIALLFAKVHYAQNLTGTSLNLTDPDPIIILNATSAGQYIDNNGTNKGWPHIKIRAYDQQGGPLIDKWNITYSARENNLYFYNWSQNAIQLNFEDSGDTFFPIGKVGIGTGTAAPTASLQIKNPTSHSTALEVGPAGNSHSYFRLDRHTGKDGGILFTEDRTLKYQIVSREADDLAIFSYTKGDIVFDIQATTGNIGIGTSSPTEKLSVDGTVLAKKVRVSIAGADWPDYVFSPNFELRSLQELETYIKANQHLPEVLSAQEVEDNGLDLGDMDATLLKKVEELTLYLIQENKEKEELKQENKELKATLENILQRLIKLEVGDTDN